MTKTILYAGILNFLTSFCVIIAIEAPKDTSCETYFQQQPRKQFGKQEVHEKAAIKPELSSKSALSVTETGKRPNSREIEALEAVCAGAVLKHQHVVEEECAEMTREQAEKIARINATIKNQELGYASHVNYMKTLREATMKVITDHFELESAAARDVAAHISLMTAAGEFPDEAVACTPTTQEYHMTQLQDSRNKLSGIRLSSAVDDIPVEGIKLATFDEVMEFMDDSALSKPSKWERSIAEQLEKLDALLSDTKKERAKNYGSNSLIAQGKALFDEAMQLNAEAERISSAFRALDSSFNELDIESSNIIGEFNIQLLNIEDVLDLLSKHNIKDVDVEEIKQFLTTYKYALRNINSQVSTTQICVAYLKDRLNKVDKLSQSHKEKYEEFFRNAL